MSRTVEWDGLEETLGDLSEEDLRYLHDRARITDEQLANALGEDEDELAMSAVEGLSAPTPVEDITNTGDANTAGLSKARHEHMLKRMAKEQADPHDTGEGDEDDSEFIVAPGHYRDEGVTNDDLRAEIARRNEADDLEMSVSGNKETLIATLEAYDNEADDEDEE